jgi:hypothetical protein
MSKKFNHILFILLLIASNGMTFSLHYCANSLASVNLIIHENNCCDDASDCCHNETYKLKKLDLFSYNFPAFDLTTIEFETPFVKTFEFNEDFDLKNTAIYTEFPPPPKIQTRLSRLQSYLL